MKFSGKTISPAINRFSPAIDIVHRIEVLASNNIAHTAGELQKIADDAEISVDRLKIDLETVRRVLSLEKSNDEYAQLASVLLCKRFGAGCFLWGNPDGELWEFTGGRWLSMSSAHLRQAIADAMAQSDNFATMMTKEVVASICYYVEQATLRKVALQNFAHHSDAPLFNASNGEVWHLDAGVELRPHRPWSRQVLVSDVEFDPLAKCAHFDAALAEIFSASDDPAGMVRHFLEFLGYAVSPDRKIPTFWLLFGRGANGKSLMLELLQRMVGSDAVLSETLERFQSDRFSTSSLVGKRILLDEDIANDLVLDDGLIKKLSEAKLMTGRAPYGRRKIAFTSIALPIMAGNTFPMTADVSHGMKRRTFVIPFARTFSKDEQKLGLIDELWQERSGILNQMLEGYLRVVARGMRFEEPKECDLARNRFFEDSHPLRDFIKNRCVLEDGVRTRISALREELINYSKDIGVPAKIAGNRLKSNFETLGYKVTNIGGYPWVHGLRIINNTL